MFAPSFIEWYGFVSTKGADGTRPATTEGTSVTPGTAGVPGSYANLGVLSSTYDVIDWDVIFHSINVSATNRMVIADIAIDPAGGTSFAGNIIVADLLVGAPGVQSNSIHSNWTFPLRIPVGASVGIRATSLSATATAFRVYLQGRFNPSRPDLVRTGTFCQTFGVPVSGTPGGTALTVGGVSDGAYVEVGTLDKALFYFEVGYQIDNTVISSNQIDVDIALGDATNKRPIISNLQIVTNTAESVTKRAPGRYARGVIGDKIYARAQGNTADTGNSVAVYGVG